MLTAGGRRLWERAVHTGIPHRGDVCVQVDVGPIVGNDGEIISHRIVRLPALAVGEPQEGPRVREEPRSEPR